MHIVGVDPGKISGLFIYNSSDTLHLHTEIDECGRNDLLHRIEESLRSFSIIACERFTMLPSSRRHTSQTDALEIIGAIKYIASTYDVKCELYGASEASKSGNDATLKLLGWYTPTKDHHANRAAAQVVHALTVHYPKHLQDLLEAARMSKK